MPISRAALLALGWGWAAAIVWLSLTPSPPDVGFEEGDKLGHFASYALLMLWFARLRADRAWRLAHAIGFVAMGVALEFAQAALGYRAFELLDMLANSAGIAAGWGAALAAERLRA